MTRPTLIAQDSLATESWGDRTDPGHRAAAPQTWRETSEAPTAGSAPRPLSAFGTTVLPHLDPALMRPTLQDRTEARFVPIGQLGEGGLGEVVAAMDQDIGRKVAIKRIRTDRLSEAVLIRFLQEIRTVGRLDHANIVPIHDVGRDPDGALYFVMRHVDGETLEDVIGKLRDGDPDYHRRFGFERRVRIIAAVLEALSYAHAQGVIHRDIKPGNVMIAKYGEVLLLDWGIAKFVDELDGASIDAAHPTSRHQTKAGAVIGTPAYMAPEQARGESVDARADLYSVSVMMHELLTLTHYLEDLDDVDELIASVTTRPVPLASMVPSAHQDPVPMDLSWFVSQGVQKDPIKRYQTADAMLERLARRAEGDVPVQCHITFIKTLTSHFLRFLDRHVMAVAMVAMMFLVAAMGVVAVGAAMALHLPPFA